MALIVNGFVRDVLQHLPMEFMAETQKLIGIQPGRLGGLTDATNKSQYQGIREES